MANTLGTFQYLGANRLPMGALDGGQDTGAFTYLGRHRLPMPYLFGAGGFTHLWLGVLPVAKLFVGTQPVSAAYLGATAL